MSRELHITYRLTLETLSPIHIGSGKGELLQDYDFIVEGNRAVIVNLERLPAEIDCLLYTSPSPRDRTRSRMPSSA